MSDPDGTQPDPIADVGDVDIDALLERTSELADQAGKEVGGLDDDSGPDAPPSDRTPAVGDVPGAGDEPSSAEAGDSADSDDVDAKLAELEAMLNKVAGEPREPAAAEQGTEADADQAGAAEQAGSEPVAEAEAEDVGEKSAANSGKPEAASGSPEAVASDVEDYDDFDIAVDLSDDDKQTSEQEIAEKLAGASHTEDATGADARPATIVGRVLAAGFNAVGWVFVALDRPFVNVSAQAKQVVGYIGIATIVVAVVGIVYGSLAY